MLRVSSRTIRRWAERGTLPAIQIGGIRRYRADHIGALIDPTTNIGHAENVTDEGSGCAGNAADAKTDGDGVGYVTP